MRIKLAEAPRSLLEAEEEEKTLQKRIEEEAGPCKTSIDLRYFTEIKPDLGRMVSRQKCFRVYENGKIQFNMCATKEIKAERLRVLINSAGTIIVLDPVEVGGHALKRNKTSGVLLQCRNAVKHLKEAGIKIPAYYSIEWDEHLEAWVGRLIK